MHGKVTFPCMFFRALFFNFPFFRRFVIKSTLQMQGKQTTCQSRPFWDPRLRLGPQTRSRQAILSFANPCICNILFHPLWKFESSYKPDSAKEMCFIFCILSKIWLYLASLDVSRLDKSMECNILYLLARKFLIMLKLSTFEIERKIKGLIRKERIPFLLSMWFSVSTLICPYLRFKSHFLRNIWLCLPQLTKILIFGFNWSISWATPSQNLKKDAMFRWNSFFWGDGGQLVCTF